ncbi:hypothetical protein [Mesorhizobium sp. M8A.F.Ca.ET.165.01.1.1]|uniref:hypothetical protein n=1 Tax=Mesorhizobium sp. M8A.F.Ca.ET.165.01.1.1 TaxID=2563960 RepID=UPI001093D402|nr:hypothetical protein [Mesorhizobium sp. M8A.F.Ca.ET.165.01.1.1]TGT42626.1 hypothetical protein EN808_12085 [Mesorhizobium sp. M8A.F.Ca.ET.165.01.1.1]
MMQTDFQPDEAVTAAALYLVSPRERTGRATIPDLRTRFGITTMQAVEAMRLANRLKGGGADADAS